MIQKKNIKQSLLFFLMLLMFFAIKAEDGYRLWLRYDKISNTSLLAKYRTAIQLPFVVGVSGTTNIVQEELSNGLSGLLGMKIICNNGSIAVSTLICGTPGQSSQIDYLSAKLNLNKIGQEGFVISTQIISGKKRIIIAANTDIGVL